MADTPDAARLSLRGVTKRYPTVLANDGIDLDVMPGEIHAVLGENGAGKSTLMKIIYGIVEPDAGTIRWEGDVVHVGNPARARKLGIGMVFQHFSLFETLSVADNIRLALDPSQTKRLRRRIRDVSARYGLPLVPARRIHTMSVGERQRVEIVRCLLQDPRLLIMDEPTSVLTPQEVERLFETLRRLAHEGCAILYISHKLEEIRALCERATIMRLGKVVAHCDPRKETAKHLAELMIGTELKAASHHARNEANGGPRLEVKNLSLKSEQQFGTDLKNISFAVKGGEILGIGGIAGNGQAELMSALSGEMPAPSADAIAIDRVAAGRLGPRERRALGGCFVPEERNGH